MQKDLQSYTAGELHSEDEDYYENVTKHFMASSPIGVQNEGLKREANFDSTSLIMYLSSSTTGKYMKTAQHMADVCGIRKNYNTENHC